MKMEFVFDVDELVVVAPLGVKGVVTSCAVNSSREKTYYVQGASDGQWWPEKFLVSPDPVEMPHTVQSGEAIQAEGVEGDLPEGTTIEPVEE